MDKGVLLGFKQPRTLNVVRGGEETLDSASEFACKLCRLQLRCVMLPIRPSDATTPWLLSSESGSAVYYRDKSHK